MLNINNTLESYLQNVEIKGNTIQNPNDLSDIKSVGDKVGDEKLYKIPIVCCGVNLCPLTVYKKEVALSNGIESDVDSVRISDYIRINPNSQYLNYVSVNGGDLATTSLRWYDKDKNYINGSSMSSKPSNASFVRLRYTGLSATDNVEFYLYEGGTYRQQKISYQEHKITILSPTQIEKVGDVEDRIIEKDGVWGVEKNIENDVISNSTNWLSSSGFHYLSGLKFNVENGKPVLNNFNPFGSSSTQVMFVNNGELLRVYTDKTLEELKNFIVINGLKLKYPTTKPQFIPLPNAQQVKLRTFANKTNISFLTEVEGTIKADVAKSISASVNSNTQEISKINNRILDLEGLKESQEMSYETDKGYLVCKETKNGTVKDLKVKGKSLVNICKKRRLTVIGNGSDLVSDIGSLAYPIENEIDFTVIVKVPSDLPSNKCFLRGYDRNGSMKVGLFTGDELYQNRGKILVKKVTNQLNFETPTINIRLFADRTASEGDSFSLDDVIVLIGDHTQNPPSGYFEGIASVGTGVDKIEVSSVKGDGNLFDMKWFKDNGINNSNVEISALTDANLTPGIKFEDNTVYYFKTDAEKLTGNGELALQFHYKNGIKKFQMVSKGTFKSDGNSIDYISFSYSDDARYNIKDVCISKIDMEYQSIKQDKKTLLFKDVDNTLKPITGLRGIDLNNYDIIDSVNNKYIVNTTPIIFNGTHDIVALTEKTNTMEVTIDTADYKIKTNTGFELNWICDKLPSMQGSDDVPHIRTDGSAPYAKIKMYLPKSYGTTKEQINASLAQSPITFIGTIVTPLEYELAPLFLESFENETMILCESGAVKSGIEWKITSYITNLVSTNTKRIKRIENDFYNYTVSQNRMMLSSRYNADRADFRIDNTLGVPKTVSVELDYDLFELMKKVVIVGKDNYDRSKIEEQMDFYVTEGFIDWDMWDELFAIIELQHNPPVDLIPIEPISIEEPKPKKSRRGRKKKVEEI